MSNSASPNCSRYKLNFLKILYPITDPFSSSQILLFRSAIPGPSPYCRTTMYIDNTHR